MFTWYSLFKFLHVVAAIVWVGGVITLVVLNARLARQRDDVALRLLSHQSAFFGQAVLGPAAITTLVAGLALVRVTGSRFQLWVVWGLAGVLVSIVIGRVFLRRSSLELAALSSAASADRTRMAALRRRLGLLNALNVLLLLSTVWAMVFKPTL